MIQSPLCNTINIHTKDGAVFHFDHLINNECTFASGPLDDGIHVTTFIQILPNEESGVKEY